MCRFCSCRPGLIVPNWQIIVDTEPSYAERKSPRLTLMTTACAACGREQGPSTGIPSRHTPRIGILQNPGCCRRAIVPYLLFCLKQRGGGCHAKSRDHFGDRGRPHRDHADRSKCPGAISGRRCIPRPDQECHVDRASGVSGVGPLLPTRFYPGVRAVPLLVPALPVSARSTASLPAAASAGLWRRPYFAAVE